MAEAVDVLFVNPGDRRQIYQSLGDEFSAIEPPVFAGLFATYVRRKGASAAIIDVPALAISAEKCAEMAVQDFKPRLVVIVVYGFQPSASTQNMSSAGKIAREIKKLDPTVKVMMTGTHPAALPERTMRDESVDFVCDLEGPATIFKTLEAIRAQGVGYDRVASLWWREDGKIAKPKSAEPLITDLDGEMPGIAWDLLPMDRYRAHNWHCFDHIQERSPYASIHTSLGCPYKCSFCCINAPFGKSSYRMWSPETVIKEIDHLVERYGVKNIKFVDEMFVLNKRHVLGLCDLLAKRDYKVNIWAYARVDTVQDQFLDALKGAGINWLCLGIESASDHVRDGALKKYGNDDIIDVVRRIQKSGIYVLGNYIFGLPDDTIDRMQQTLDLATELNCEFANFYSAMAYPGSALYRMATESDMALPAEWHQFSQHSYDALPLANRHCSSDEILRFRDRAWSEYFTNPKYLAMIAAKFGPDVVAHLERLAKVTLTRRYLDRAAA
ncbi:MAG: radical SAM protein [Alphaproteobacteria bacterium]|nr:radical SAM protein [Alphaproteobacteria bacterium]